MRDYSSQAPAACSCDKNGTPSTGQYAETELDDGKGLCRLICMTLYVATLAHFACPVCPCQDLASRAYRYKVCLPGCSVMQSRSLLRAHGTLRADVPCVLADPTSPQPLRSAMMDAGERCLPPPSFTGWLQPGVAERAGRMCSLAKHSAVRPSRRRMSGALLWYCNTTSQPHELQAANGSDIALLSAEIYNAPALAILDSRACNPH